MIYLCKFNAFGTNGEYLREVRSIGNIIERSHRLRQMISISNGYLVRHRAIPHSQKVQWLVLACKRSSWSPIIIMSCVLVLIKRKTNKKTKKKRYLFVRLKKFSLCYFSSSFLRKIKERKIGKTKYFFFILTSRKRQILRLISDEFHQSSTGEKRLEVVYKIRSYQSDIPRETCFDDYLW